MNKFVFLILCLLSFTMSSFAQETYIKSNKTWRISRSKRIVMTPFVVKSNKAVLRWNARTQTNGNKVGKNLAGGYSVYISTTGNSTKNFTEKPILRVRAENAAWTRHSVSLSRYEGKKVWVAFVSEKVSRSTLYLNELYAGVPSCTYLLADVTKSIPLPI